MLTVPTNKCNVLTLEEENMKWILSYESTQERENGIMEN